MTMVVLALAAWAMWQSHIVKGTVGSFAVPKEAKASTASHDREHSSPRLKEQTLQMKMNLKRLHFSRKFCIFL
jgi:hypothetical protein